MRIGIIGCGHWGKNYVRVMNEIRGAQVVECADVSRSNLDAVKERYPFINTVLNIDDLLNNPKLDAVIISTPASTHYTYAKKALLNGKDVLVEKPMATSAKECEELAKIASEKKKVLMIGHTFLYNNSVRCMKEIVTTNDFGNIYYMYAKRNNLGPIREDVSVIWDLSPHDVSIFNYIQGSVPVAVSCVAKSFLKDGRYDVAFLTLFYASGVVGNIQVSWIDSDKVREVVIVGAKKRIVFDDLNMKESVRIFDKGVSVQRDIESFGEFHYLLRDGDIISPKIEHVEPLKNLCVEFIESIKLRKEPLSNAKCGYDVVTTIDAAMRSAKEQGRKIDV